MDALVAFLVSIRAYFYKSDERITSLKMVCVEKKIKYRAIIPENEVRFPSYLDKANYVFCQMCPAYMEYFNRI